MGLKGGEQIADIALDRVFIGSCTNSRIEDLRVAAKIVAGQPGRRPRRRDGGAGLGPREGAGGGRGARRVFTAAGFEWREPGCSMCLAMNPDKLEPGERCASTSNRNFEGRQGPQGPHPPGLAGDGGGGGHRRPFRRRSRLALSRSAGHKRGPVLWTIGPELWHDEPGPRDTRRVSPMRVWWNW